MNMLIRNDSLTINLNNVIGFKFHQQIIIFYLPYLDVYKEPDEIWLNFKDDKSAKKAFDRIIYAYANEYRTLDLSEYDA